AELAGTLHETAESAHENAGEREVTVVAGEIEPRQLARSVIDIEAAALQGPADTEGVLPANPADVVRPGEVITDESGARKVAHGEESGYRGEFDARLVGRLIHVHAEIGDARRPLGHVPQRRHARVGETRVIDQIVAQDTVEGGYRVLGADL